LLSPAADEITEAAWWFDAQCAGLGSEFWQTIDATIAQISANPRRFGKSEFASDDLELRFAIVRRFNYVVHFLVDVDDVQVVAVAHAARRPGYWLSRCRE
jgi:plasmid stabilization system protein ParE